MTFIAKAYQDGTLVHVVTMADCRESAIDNICQDLGITQLSIVFLRKLGNEETFVFV